MKKLLWLFSTVAILVSCEWLEENTPAGLSDEDVIDGLKTALTVGTDSSAKTLSALNGYYEDPLLKIPLPEEAEKVRSFVTNNVVAEFFSLDQEFEDVIKSINRAAEESAKEAAPIFKEAISDLTISEGWDILNGVVPDGTKSSGFDSTAATQFLKNQTYTPLTALYSPKINGALGADLGLGFSATDAWETLTTNYNNTLNSTAVQAALTAAQFLGNPVDVPDEMNTDLGVFATEKALDGLFYMVGEEEKEIRRNPFEWALDIIQKVFGFIQENV